MNNLILLDLLSPKGHRNLNKKICVEFLNHGCEINYYTSDDFFEFLKTSFFHINWMNDSSNRFVLFFKFLLFFIKSLKNFEKNNPIVFLSYDFIHFPFFFFYYLFGFKVYTFEHNTVPEGNYLRTTVLLYLHKIFAKSFTRICLSPVVTDFFQLHNCNSIYIGHYVVELIEPSEPSFYLSINSKYVFVPTGSYDLDTLLNFSNKFSHLTIVVKRNDVIPSTYSNIHQVDYLDYNDYCFLLKNCLFVYLPVSFKYRVSGPFYESLFFSKSIVLSESGFSSFIYNDLKFSNHVFLNELPSRFEISKVFDYKDYNQSITAKLLKVLCA